MTYPHETLPELPTAELLNWMTVADASVALGLGIRMIYLHILAGRLPARRVKRPNQGGRAEWRINPEALQQFKAAREPS